MGLTVGEGRLSIGKCSRDAGGAELSVGVPFVGTSDLFASGGYWVAYHRVEDRVLGVLAEFHALEFVL